MSKAIVITGSTRGIGKGLAENFLKLGAKVAISGTRAEDVERLVSELAAQFGASNVAGAACDITNPTDLEDLWQTAENAFGSVDIWISRSMNSLLRAFSASLTSI